MSSGLAKRASATVVDRPKAASWSAAFRHLGKPRAERQDGDRRAFAHDAALADLERHALGRQLDADALAARIAEGARPVVDGDGGRHHVHQLGLVGGRHQHEARQAAEVGEIEGAGMRGAVGADEAGAVEGKAHRQALDGDVVHDLVVGALQERRVDGRERLVALASPGPPRTSPRAARRCRRRRCGRGIRLPNRSRPGARRHGGRDGDDLGILARLLDQAFGEHLGVAAAHSAWPSPARR